MGSMPDVLSGAERLLAGEARRISPFFIPRALPNMASGQIAIAHGLQGVNHAAATACAAGAHSIGDAFRFIQGDYCDVMVAGGAEACLDPLSIAGFDQLKALSRGFNERPTEASRPFDRQRDGFVIGEGAACLVLEEMEHARKRGAEALCEVVGYGLSGDALHITMPSGDGAVRSMKMALKMAGLEGGSQVAYVNAHATSTQLGDRVEACAIESVLGKGTMVSSTKGAMGHLLGAAGAVEAVVSVMALKTGYAPPTMNLKEPIEGSELHFIMGAAERLGPGNLVLSNSFGFGGTNCSLVFAKV